MNDRIYGRLRHCLVATAATISLGCAGARPSSTYRHSAVQRQLPPSPASSRDHRNVTPGECENLQPPAGSKLAAHVYASGVQIYRWSGTAWTFVGPEAVLSADAGGKSKVGTHYAGPTWESVSGSKVAGTVAQRCTPDSTAIPWLSLNAVSNDGPGIFRRVTFIQRMHTVGGNAPSSPGDSAGAEVRVPYSAEYFFYRTE
jgi:FtsP/CotA-like multicopper oxidase with cupredoxin domain